MTIDEIIEELEDSKDYPVSDPASDEALNGAIDIMRKYQKIQEIIKDWENGRFADVVGCLRVRAVIEDGNSDMDHSNL